MTWLGGGGLYQLPNHLLISQLNPHETDYLYNEIFERQTYIQHEIELTRSSCVCDIGANIGLFSLFVAERVPCGNIYAFEPITPIFEHLKQNVVPYGDRVKVFNEGVGECEGVSEFVYFPHLCSVSGLRKYIDWGELTATLKQVSFNHNLLDETPGNSSRSDVELLLSHQIEDAIILKSPVRSLSKVMTEERIERIDLLKIDVEGAEMEVLAGLAGSDWNRISQMVIEVHDNIGGHTGRIAEAAQMLRDHDYKVAVEADPKLKGTGICTLYGRRWNS
jgi:FkbM family methyltransferase